MRKTSVALGTVDGVSVAERVRCAFSWPRRALGLLGRAALADDSGLWLSPCRSVHTLGMRMAIDVVFLDAELRVLRVCEALPPWRVRLGPNGTRTTLELNAGRAARVGLRRGDELVMQGED